VVVVVLTLLLLPEQTGRNARWEHLLRSFSFLCNWYHSTGIVIESQYQQTMEPYFFIFIVVIIIFFLMIVDNLCKVLDPIEAPELVNHIGSFRKSSCVRDFHIFFFLLFCFATL
jgi:hypothetical protein